MCDGMGWRPRSRHDEPWDAYLELPVAEALELRPTDQGGASRVTEKERSEAYGWERMRLAMRKAGSYDQLERALERMRVVFPSGYRAVSRRYLWGLDVEVDRGLEVRALIWLSHNMTSVRVPAWLSSSSSSSRNGASARDEVLRLREVGMGAGKIARRLNMPKNRVKKILRAR